MIYSKTVTLKDGQTCILRNGVFADGKAALENFILTHTETDFLLSYPDECEKTSEEEGRFLQNMTDSENSIEILAVLDGKVVGLAGFSPVGQRLKIRHRAEFGVSVAKDCWNLGIGAAMTDACIECAKRAGFEQLELEVVADNAAAVGLYKKFGFVEFGRNPKGFMTKNGAFQELVHMRLDLKK